MAQKPIPPLNSKLCRRLAVLTGWSGAGFLIINAILWLVPDFAPQTGVLLRRFGMTLVVYAALTPFLRTLMTWLVTMHNAPGQRILRFGISEYEVVLAIVGTLILTTGSVMAEATRLAEDNRQII